ncbi:MAG TPA: chloride channel protein, partial [Cyclobacteriaceae bacterium]|nr:chloride channel protein [Cyclobacteriaceae bacterium]
MKPHQFVRRIVLGMRHKMSDRQFFVLSSVVVGFSAGLVAVALKYLVHQTADLVITYTETNRLFWVFAFLPLLGISCTVFYVHKFLHGKFRKGTAEIQYAIAKESSLLPASQIYSHAVTSALTVGLGGSTGLESPIVSIGAAL